MDFVEIETRVRKLISQSRIKESIDLLSDFLKDDPDLDKLVVQSGRYNRIKEKEQVGTGDKQEIERALSELGANLLDILKSKKEYIKYKEQTFGDKSISETTNQQLIHVFLSVASPFNDDQQNYINKLTLYFKENGILLDTLTDWNDNDPLVPILDQMRKSSGCLVLALERYHITKGIEKRGSDQEVKLIDQSYTSPWLHIETALARSLNLPLIILKDVSLINEGLIHNDKQEWGIVRINQANINEIDEYPIKNFILNWINQVKLYEQTKNGI